MPAGGFLEIDGNVYNISVSRGFLAKYAAYQIYAPSDEYKHAKGMP